MINSFNKVRNKKYYSIAHEGSDDTSHPAMKLLKNIAGEVDKVLDLGCGEGTRLNHVIPNGKIGYGIDISSIAIDAAKKKYPHHFQVGNLEKLPYKDSSFDLVYSAYVFEHLDNPEKVIKEGLRVLKKGGYFLVVCPNYGSPNRASPPFWGNRISKLIKGYYDDIFHPKNLDWKKVNPIATESQYEIDWDTTIEPYLGSLERYLSNKGLKIVYSSSCWEREERKVKYLQRVIRLLGERNIYPFNKWGPHLLIVAKKGEGDCELCGNDSYNQLFKKDRYEILQCKKCKLVKTSGVSEIDYSDYHRDSDYEKFNEHFRNIFQNIYSLVSRYVSRPAKILEIGCSTGTLLSLFKENGWEVWGIEPSKSFWNAQEKGIKVLGVSLLEAKLEEASFDLVVINHTLEHMSKPLDNLKKAYKLLKKGGKIYIGVPNFDSLDSRLWKSKWKMLLPEEHNFQYTPQTLKKVLEKVGFKIVEMRTNEGIWSLSSPLKGLVDEIKNRKRAFLIDLISSPFALFSTIVNKGSNLIVIAEK